MGLINSNMENAQQVDGVPENAISRCGTPSCVMLEG